MTEPTPLDKIKKAHGIMFLAGGVALAAPFVMILGLGLLGRVVTFNREVPATLSAVIWGLGQVTVVLPLLTIPVSAAWVGYASGDHESSKVALRKMMKRYAPIFCVLIAQAFSLLKESPMFLASLVAGVLMVGYSVWLLRSDESQTNTEGAENA
ncbi:MAG: hypothetical protein ABII00_18575 [Elusimicrobiota bacterium]